MQKKLALAAAAFLVVTAVASTIFWARLPHRLPTDADYRQANALIAGQLQPGDIIVLAPAWAEAGRPFLTSAPVYAGYDLAHDEYPGARRQWLLALADAPHFDLQDARAALLARGSSAAPGQRIGGLWLEPFTIAGPQQLFSFMDQLRSAAVTITSPRAPVETCSMTHDGIHQCSRGPWNQVRPGWYEVQERPVHCMWAHPVDNGALRIQYDAVPLHGRLRGWGAFVGNAAEGGGAPVDLQVELNGQSIKTVEFPNAFGKRNFELTLPGDANASGKLAFVVSTPNSGRRHFCFDAWVEK